MATRPSQKPGTPRNVQCNLLVSLKDTPANLFRLQDLLKNKGKSRWIWSFATSPCVGLVAGRRGLRLGARLLPQCGMPKYLDEQAS